MTVNNLLLNNTVGNLFSGFSSSLLVGRMLMVNVTVAQVFIYLFHSDAIVRFATMKNVTLGEQGSLATISSHSSLSLISCSLTGVSAYEHGVISLHRSTLSISSSTITGFNVSLIIAQQSSISVAETEVSGVELGDAKMSLVPNGGLLSCLNCPSVILTSVTCHNMSANRGGVVYAQVTDPDLKAIVMLTNSYFHHCTAQFGGVVSTENALLIIFSCIFTENTAKYGGAASFQSSSLSLEVHNSSFLRNFATIAGSCLWWSGLMSNITSNNFKENSALYGNPQATDPHHLLLLSPGSLQPVTLFPLQGVTGQLMQQPLLVGVFDILGQLIVTDNVTLVSAILPSHIRAIGSKQALAVMGIATFALVLSPFSTETFKFTFSAESIVSVNFEYQFRDCQPGETRSQSGCFPCPRNSYSLEPANPLCHECLDHVQCRGRAELVLYPEYWRANNLTDVIYPCLMLSSCLGGLDSACAPGYTGTLCSACTENYYRFAFWQCRHCSDEMPAPARGVLIALLVVSTVVVPPHLFLSDHGVMYRCALALIAFFYYAQIILYVSLLHVKWGFSTLVFNEILRVIGSLGALLVHGDCQGHSSFSQAITLSCYPLLLLTASCLFWSLRCLWHRKQVLVVTISAGCTALYIYLPVLSFVVVSILQCQEVAGDNWLVADMTEKCWSRKHLLYVWALAVPLLVLIVGSHIFAILCCVKPPNSQVYHNFQKYLTSGYTEELNYWEIYFMVRKLELAYLSLLYPILEAFSSSVLFVCILGFSLQSDIKWAPYKYPLLAKLKFASHITVVLVLFTSIHQNEPLITSFATAGTSILLLLGTLMVVRSNRYAVGVIRCENDFDTLQHRCQASQSPLAVFEESQDDLSPPAPSLLSQG